jgi:hypothetical protein
LAFHVQHLDNLTKLQLEVYDNLDSANLLAGNLRQMQLQVVATWKGCNFCIMQLQQWLGFCVPCFEWPNDKFQLIIQQLLYLLVASLSLEDITPLRKTLYGIGIYKINQAVQL